MGVMFRDGKVLFASSGTVAMAEACCCGGDEPCCGITDFSVTLTGTITDTTGDAVGMPGSVSLPRTGAHWESADPVFEECIIRVNCSDQDPGIPDEEVQWWLENPGGCWNKTYRTSVTCDPIVIVFHVTTAGGSFTLTVTV